MVQNVLSQSSSTTSTSSTDTKRAVDEATAQLPTECTASNCNGNKKSLFIGINYFGTKSELRGCIEDVKNIKGFVQKFNFKLDDAHSLTLTDDQKDPSKVPTRDNILKGLEWLVAGAKEGDSLFFHYSGHGAQVKDTDPSDEIDGMDEAIVPLDYDKAGMILDDVIYDRFVKGLPAGVRLTAIMDCCHSGSIFDLPFTYNIDGTIGSQVRRFFRPILLLNSFWV